MREINKLLLRLLGKYLLETKVIEMTLKSVINEGTAKVNKKRWNAYYFVGNLAALCCKGFSHYFEGSG
ncbi:MAG: hypothetical protein ACKO5O_06840, partial [Cylindrospermopsis raciborskii]